MGDTHIAKLTQYFPASRIPTSVWSTVITNYLYNIYIIAMLALKFTYNSVTRENLGTPCLLVRIANHNIVSLFEVLYMRAPDLAD